ncbi:unnamed protein product, partial [Mesorhabditis belari]|uniref:Basement membrane proteoglycan n=1 Tax=Mesorhabditis belari TaxID=2138241 RepID=A0AAF3FFQ2_9BILA
MFAGSRGSMGRPLLAIFLAIALIISPDGVEAGKRARKTRSRTHFRRQANINAIDDIGQDVQITIYPTEAQIRDGKDASFDCRARTADNSVYPPVRWTRVGGPLPANAHESTGRLTISPVSPSDSGRYVCTSTHNGRTVEASANLNVLSYGPQELQGVLPTSGACGPDERQCGNNECVKNEYVCDGEPDCRDRSDEQNCPAMRQCEPNEHRCNNQRCVQKMWLCDGDDDCGDGSDELSCGVQAAGDVCKKTDDEVGCVQPTVVEPPETHKEVQRGRTFELKCKAVAVPEPYINWRLNWGPVCEPPRCLQTSEGGVGVLTVQDAQPLDQGAYTCEAINVKGRVLATPDCIVRVVDYPSPNPPPPQPPARPQIQCDVRGSVTTYPQAERCECKPLVQGPSCDQCQPGSFHLTEKAPQGCIKCFCFGVTNQCQSSSLYRTKEAECEELLFAGDAEGVTLSDIEERTIDYNPKFEFTKPGFLTYNEECPEQFWRLPKRFLGNKVTAYGGKMEFEIEYQGSGGFHSEPLVVLKGNQIILVHRLKDQERVLRPGQTAKITIETWESNWEQLNGAPATREDLMMVLADLDALLIRAQHVESQYSTSLGRVSWEVATERTTSDGQALEVEQCQCPPGYSGTSCEDCAPGYERSGTGSYLGTCVPIQRQPQVTCSTAGAISPYGHQGRCQCKPYTTGPNCDQCAAKSFHLSPQNPQGCIPCFCMGITDQCQSSTYQRSTVNIDYSRGDRDPLSLTSSDVHQPFTPREQAQVTGSEIRFNRFGEARGQTLYWKLSEKFTGNKVTSYGGTLKYVFKFEGYGTPNQDADVIIRGNEISLQHKAQLSPRAGAENSLEVKFFEDRWQRTDGGAATREHLLMALADLDTVLIKATYNDDPNGASSLLSTSLEYAEAFGGNGQPAYEVEQCQCPPGYTGTSCEKCAPGFSRSGKGLYLGTCERCECNGHASQCDKEYGFCIDCQHNTEGDQCERCKPGFVGDARRGTPHDCQPAPTKPPCQCNNHSPRGCDSFGRCLLCEHNTEGVHCERCKKGYYGDATRGRPDDCTPCPCPGASDCFLDPQGQVSCRICPAGLTGRTCQECAPGYTRNTKQDGRQCIPIGDFKQDHIDFIPAPDARLRVEILEKKHQFVYPGERVQWTCRVASKTPPEPVQIEWQRVGYSNLPDGAFDDGQGNLSLESVQSQDVGVYRCKGYTSGQFANDDAHLRLIEERQEESARHRPFAPTTTSRPFNDQIDNERGQSTPQPIVEPAGPITVNEGEPVSLRCHVPGIPDCQITWHKEYIGGPLPHGVYQAGNAVKIPQAQLKDAGNYVCSAVTQYGIGKAPDVQVNVVRPPPPPPPSDPIPPPPRRSSKKCDTRPRQPPPPPPPTPMAEIWTPPPSIPDCSDAPPPPPTRPPPRQCGPRRGPPPPPPRPEHCLFEPVRIIVDPPRQVVPEGEPARFKCTTPGHPNLPLSWTRLGGGALPPGAQQIGGILYFPRTSQGDVGQYVCQTHNPATNQPLISTPVSLELERTQSPPLVDPPVQTVWEGSPAQIRCWIPGVPNAQIDWTRADGQQINQNSEQRDGTLKIFESKMSDTGDYQCTATDPRTGVPQRAPIARVNVRLETQTPVAPVVDPPVQTVDEGKQSEVRCWVPGQPDAQIRWMKNQRDPLPRHAYERGGVLTIRNTQQSDAGTYTCIASDPQGRNPQNVPAIINVNRPLGPIVVNVDPKYQVRTVGDPFYIRCWVDGHPNIKVDWRKVTGDLSDEAVQQKGDLKVERSEMDDAGDYICSAKDPNSGEIVDSVPAAVVIVDNELPPVDEAVEIHPPSQTVPEKSSATIRCFVPGNPDAKLSFKRVDGEPVSSESDENQGVLTFRTTSLSDTGDYVCVYHPDDGRPPKQSTVSKLIVTSAGTPPRPEATPPLLIVPPGAPARFHCNPNSNTPAKVKWGYGSADGPLRGDVQQDGDDLVINSADESLVGKYVCSATNDFGRGEAPPVELKISDEEQPPTAKVVPRTWIGKPHDRHQFDCIVTGVPTPTVTWTGPNGAPLAHDVTQLDDNKLDFADGRSELNGDYTCTAKNSVGEAQDHGSVLIGPTLHVITDPPGPRIVVGTGEPIRIKCMAVGAPGDPEPEVEWLHDPGPERGDLPDDFVPITISEQYIHHPSIGLGNAGTYTCKGSNAVATATRNIYIEVVEPSKIATVSVLGGSVQLFDLGEPGEVTCAATGTNLVDRLEWTKVNDQLPQDVEEHNEQGVLHFPSFKQSYTGEYECRGYRGTELIASAIVEVHASNEDVEEPRVTIDPPRVRVVAQGDSIVLNCAVEGAKASEHFEWALLRGGSLIRKLGNQPKLTIPKADPTNDYGVYRCNVEDDNGLVVGSAFAAVTIGYSSDKNPEELKFDEKADATLTCPVFTVPGSKVEWSRKDGELPSNAVPMGNKLEIKDFNDDSAGLYVCKVNVENQVVEGYVDAKIFVPDTIIQVMLETSSDSVNIGERVWFDCKVTGDDTATISWVREGADSLPDNAQVTGKRLQFNQLREDNAGGYKCIAKTKAATLEAKTVLNIGGVGGAYLDLHSVTRGIGQDAHLYCPIALPTPRTPVQWNRADDKQMSVNAKVDRGILTIPSVSRSDAGVYTCSAPAEDGSGGTAEIQLKVTSMIPSFNGSSWIELPPLGDSQFANLQLDINFKPKTHDGLLIYTDKVNPSRHETNFHSGGVRDGKFVYTYDIGHGVEHLETRNEIRLNEWNQIQINNTQTYASIKLNDGETVSRGHKKPTILQYEAVSLDIGGTSGIQGKYLTKIPSNYKGVIASVLVDGEPLDLSVGKRVGEVALYDACQYEPCQNGGHCIPANVGHGFICQCDPRFAGEFCEKRSNVCGPEDCNTGICLENHEEGTWRCVCPLGVTGKNCELHSPDPLPETISFSGENSFFSMPSPSQIDNFSVSMKIMVPKTPKNESMLLYLASSYSATSKGFLNLAIIDNHLVYMYENGAGKTTISSTHRLHEGEENVIELRRENGKTTLILNGQRSKSVTSSSFRPGTDLFVGGLSPGIPKNRKAALDPFGGCVNELIVNGKRVDFRAKNTHSSGDLQKCERTVFETARDRNELTENLPAPIKPSIFVPTPPPTRPPTPTRRFELPIITEDPNLRFTQLPTRATTTTTTTTTKNPEIIIPELEEETQMKLIVDPKNSFQTVFVVPDHLPSEDPHFVRPTEGANIDPGHQLPPYPEDESALEGHVEPGKEPTEVLESEETDQRWETLQTDKPTEITTTTTTTAPHILPTDTAQSNEWSAERQMSTTTTTEEPEPEVTEIGADGTLRTTDRVIRPTVESDLDAAIEQADDYPVFTPRQEETNEEHFYELSTDREPMEVHFEKPTPTPSIVTETEKESQEEITTTVIIPAEEAPSQIAPHEIPTQAETWHETETRPELDPGDLEPTELPTPEVNDWSTQLPMADLNDHSGELSGEEIRVGTPSPTRAPTTGRPTTEQTHIAQPDPYVTPCPGGRCKWADLCAGQRCGMNGVCRQLNESHFECQCRIYYDGPNCDIFKPIEHAARFDGDAFIEMAGDDFPHTSSEIEETIEFKFKTKHMNGVMLWQGQNPDQSLVGEDYVSIGVRDGFLVFAYELGGGAAEMVSHFRVDDGLEHNVIALRKGRDGAMFVDNFPPINSSSSGILAMLNVDGNIFVGGVPDLSFMTGGLHSSNFIGCVADVTLNGEKLDLMGSAVDGQNVRPCDEWVTPKRRVRSRHGWGRNF